MLARLQQIITLSLFAAASAWMIEYWSTDRLAAISGYAVIILGYSAILAAEFLVMRIVGGSDSVPRPPARQMWKAWIGETLVAPRVFFWRQPFRANAIPDQLQSPSQGRRGVVLIHGFFCNRGFWTPWLKRLVEAGHPYVAVNLEPVLGSIDDYGAVIESAVQNVTNATGRPPVLVCHSMGGLAARAWLRRYGGASRAHHVITIGTPHQGTWLGQFSRVTNGSQMKLSSLWLGKLFADEATANRSPFTCWYSNCDNIVFPATMATLPGADNRLVEGVAHVQLAFHEQVVEGSLAIIGAL